MGKDKKKGSVKKESKYELKNKEIQSISNKIEKASKTEKASKAEKINKTEKANKAEKENKTEKANKAVKENKVEKKEKARIENRKEDKNAVANKGKNLERKQDTHETDALMEELLGAWMRMSIGIKGNRILRELSFNEMVTCRLLYGARQMGMEITATDICKETRLLKSQVNKLLCDMEKKNLIYRHRDSEDKRRIFIRMKEESLKVYLTEHAHVMEIIAQVCERLNRDEVEILVEKMSKAVAVMDELSENP